MISPLYPGYELLVQVDLELVEWNPAVLEREVSHSPPPPLTACS